MEYKLTIYLLGEHLFNINRDLLRPHGNDCLMQVKPPVRIKIKWIFRHRLLLWCSFD